MRPTPYPRAGSRRTRGSSGGLDGRRRRRGPRSVSPVRRCADVWRISSRSSRLMSSIDSSTSSIASTSLITSLATWPELPDLQHPGPLGRDHLDAHPGVELAGRLLVGDGAEPLPRREVALLDALLQQGEDADAVVVLELLELLEAGLRRLLEHGRAGERVLERVGGRHPQPAREPRQREALDEQRAGHHRERDQQQHLAVRRIGSGITNAAARVTTPRMPAQPSTTVNFSDGSLPVVGSALGRISR